MSRALSPNFSLPPLSVAPSGRGISLESLYATSQELCLLLVQTIDGTRVDSFVSDSEIDDWYVAAAKQNVALAIRRNGDTLELYSTQQDTALACARPLETIARWSRMHVELRQLKISFQRGNQAAAHLLSSTAAISLQRKKAASTELEDLEATGRMGGSNATTSSLFRTAMVVHRRVVSEALEGNPNLCHARADMANLGAARIVEEELLVWKTEQAECCRDLSRRIASMIRRTNTSGLVALKRRVRTPSRLGGY
jgi:hypothetical protein